MQFPFAIRQLGFFVFDVKMAYHSDPAIKKKLFWVLELALYQGIHAMLFHRIAFLLNCMHIPFLPRLISQISRLITGIEIHPGAKIWKGCFIDHWSWVVIWETAEIGDLVIMYHQVTLWWTSLNAGKRHPTIGNNVLIGAWAKLFWPIKVGDNTQIWGSSVITKDVPSNCTVVWNPGRIVKRHGEKVVTDVLNQTNLPDPVWKKIQQLELDIKEIKRRNVM